MSLPGRLGIRDLVSNISPATMLGFSKVVLFLTKIASSKIHAYKTTHWCKNWFKTFKN